MLRERSVGLGRAAMCQARAVPPPSLSRTSRVQASAVEESMQQLTEEGRRIVGEMAQRHSVSSDAVMTLLLEVAPQFRTAR